MRAFYRTSRRASKERGTILVWVGFGLVAFVGIASLGIDASFLYMRRADAQKTADAAALAGAYKLSTFATPTVADAAATSVANSNGYATSAVSITDPYNFANRYHVRIATTEPLFFGSVLGGRTANVAAEATAEYEIRTDIPIGSKDYGVDNPDVNYSVFGPTGNYNNGDPYSVKFLADGTTPNPLYDPKGYDFKLVVPSNYASMNGGVTKVQVEIMDPDCWNTGGQVNASSNAMDEMRKSDGSAGTLANATTTVYTLFWDNNTPDDPTDDVQIAQSTYNGQSSASDAWDPANTFTVGGVLKAYWTLPSGSWIFDTVAHPTGNYRINVTSTFGSSENGFSLRAGPPGTHNRLSGYTPFDSGYDPITHAADGKNGTMIYASGRLPMNFNINATADIALGYVPASAKNGLFTVNKFDTDVGAVSVNYTCDTIAGTINGTLAGNGLWKTDTIPLPTTYAGGNWTAHYTAGSQDTSDWSVSYDQGTGRPGSVRLVGSTTGSW